MKPDGATMKWYEIPQVRETLEGFTQYMLRAQRGRLVMDGESGKQVWLDYNKVIHVNPEAYKKMEPEEQWSLVRADIVHEVAHARFTKKFCTGDEGQTPLFSTIWKLVEDNRIEYKMVQAEHLGKVLLPKRSGRLLAAIKPYMKAYDPIPALVTTMLAYAYGTRCGRPGWDYMLQTDEKAKWDKIKPLIDKSFFLAHDQVIDVAKEIERIIFDLETPEDTASEGELMAAIQTMGGKDAQACGEGQHGKEEGQDKGGGEEGSETGAAGKSGEGGDEESEDENWSANLKTDEPDTIYPELKGQMKDVQRRLEKHGIDNKFKRLGDKDGPSRGWGGHGSGPINDNLTLRPRDPSAMLARVNQVMPIFRDAFKVVPPLEVADLSRSGGRLSMRDYITDPTRPFVSMIEPQKAMMDMAIRVVCDVSGSMHGIKSELVTLFAMALHNAAQEFNVHYKVSTAPLNITLAEQGMDLTTGQENIMAILGTPGPHEDMGMIVEQHSSELLARPEELKLLIALHDGQSNDHSYLEKVVKAYRRKGVTILGVGLAGHEGYNASGDTSQLEAYEREMFKALREQFASDFLIPVSINKFHGGGLYTAYNWPLAREVPQKLARIIRNFRKRG